MISRTQPGIHFETRGPTPPRADAHPGRPQDHHIRPRALHPQSAPPPSFIATTHGTDRRSVRSCNHLPATTIPPPNAQQIGNLGATLDPIRTAHGTQNHDRKKDQCKGNPT